MHILIGFVIGFVMGTCIASFVLLRKIQYIIDVSDTYMDMAKHYKEYQDPDQSRNP